MTVKAGIVGCGTISKIYLTVGKTFEVLDIVACADIVTERAHARATEFNVPKAYSVEDLLRDPEIEIVINLTIPRAHAEVSLAAIDAGKSVYNEKPLAISLQDGRRILDRARSKGVRVGCAPDTVLGGGIQTCRKLIDDGWIGEPTAAVAFFTSHGPEGWHPDPDFYFQPGAGPMFDMGPYYLTTLVTLLGPISRVTGATKTTFPERTITSEPKYGQTIVVNTPTHLAGVLEFESGVIANVMTSFDVWGANLPRIEIYGTQGSLSVPDPNTFGGPVRVRRAGQTEWSEVPLTHGYAQNSRSLGVADLAAALRSGRPHRATGEIAYHVLDVMHALHDAAREHRHVELESRCARPLPLPLGLRERTLDE